MGSLVCGESGVTGKSRCVVTVRRLIELGVKRVRLPARRSARGRYLDIGVGEITIIEDA